ncbi:MAG: hypothetical protein PHN88_09115 [Ignavibacteria bacterium]|nr:hypothetical protein [Ignavibacteria bacterium]
MKDFRNKKEKGTARQALLLSFFGEDTLRVIEINGFILQKYFDNNTHRWEVGVYTPESYKKFSDYKNKYIKKEK